MDLVFVEYNVLVLLDEIGREAYNEDDDKIEEIENIISNSI